LGGGWAWYCSRVLSDNLIARFRGRVFVLTGAGISVASGIRPFRGDHGLYEGLNPYELASPEAFAERPVTVWNWYLMRIHEGKHARPNPAHKALVGMEREAAMLTVVTSNVDELHEEAGSTRVFHLHGRIFERRCTVCDFLEQVDPYSLPERVDEATLFRCRCGHVLRPNVVWFGEHPWPRAIDAVQFEMPKAHVVLEIGSSGAVSYGFTEAAAAAGIPVVVINPDAEETPGMTVINEKAEDALPRLLDRILSR